MIISTTTTRLSMKLLRKFNTLIKLKCCLKLFIVWIYCSCHRLSSLLDRVYMYWASPTLLHSINGKWWFCYLVNTRLHHLIIRCRIAVILIVNDEPFVIDVLCFLSWVYLLDGFEVELRFLLNFLRQSYSGQQRIVRLCCIARFHYLTTDS